MLYYKKRLNYNCVLNKFKFLCFVHATNIWTRTKETNETNEINIKSTKKIYHMPLRLFTLISILFRLISYETEFIFFVLVNLRIIGFSFSLLHWQKKPLRLYNSNGYRFVIDLQHKCCGWFFFKISIARGS